MNPFNTHTWNKDVTKFCHLHVYLSDGLFQVLWPVTSHPSCVCCMSYPFQPSWSNRSNISWRVHIKKLYHCAISPASYYNPSSWVHTCWNTLMSSPCSLNMTVQFSHPYKTIASYFYSTLLPTGIHYDRSSVRWSCEDGNTTAYGNTAFSSNSIWCSKDGAAHWKAPSTTEGWGVFSRWLHHRWCPCHGKWRSQVSYTSFTWAESYHCICQAEWWKICLRSSASLACSVFIEI